MNSMSGNPKNGPAFKCQSSAKGEEIFHPFWGLITPVCKQTMVAHANHQAPCHPPEHGRGEKCFAREKKERQNSPGVKRHHECCRFPVNLVVTTVSFQSFNL